MWHSYCSEVSPVRDGVSLRDDPALLSLEKLYEEQRSIEARVNQLRKEEPARKRKRRREYSLWVFLVQEELVKLHAIRDEIVKRKASPKTEPDLSHDKRLQD